MEEMTMIRPTDEGYDEARLGFQRAQSHRPELIVDAASAHDVQEAVRYAAERGMGIAAQATGHGMPIGAEGGVLIVTRRMDGVRIDPDTATARIEAGIRWEAVIDAAAEHGLAPLSGSAPHVGAVSYTLGGGIGLMARRYGFAADHVLSIEVVTASGEARTVRPGDDLFWALSGGRGAFGVVTAVEIGLFPVAELFGGALYYGAEHVPEILETYLAWTRDLPAELTSSIALIPFLDAQAIPEPLRGRHVAHVRVAFLGSAEAGEKLAAPLRTWPRLMDTLRVLPYSESGTIHNDPPFPMAYHASHAVLSDLTPAASHEILGLIGPGSPDPSIMEIRHLGGALSVPADNPVGHRDATYFFSMLSQLDSTPIEAVRPLHARFLEVLAPTMVGHHFNFLYGENATEANVRRCFSPADHDRLRALKTTYDPADLFRHTQPIRPA
jgi:FAD/FMN-containing dehydrogenase